MVRISRFAIAALVVFAVSSFLLYSTYALHLLPGGPLTRRYVFCSSLLLPIFLGALAAVIPAPTMKRGILSATAVGAGFGLLYIYFATRVLFWMEFKNWGSFGRSIFLHPMGGDLDLEALAIAATAGACGMLLAITSRSRSAILMAVGLMTIAAVVPGTAYNFICHNQELTLAIVTPQTTQAARPPEVTQRIDVQRIDVGPMTNRVLRSIFQAGITGNYQVVHLYRQGHGKKVLLVAVINGPVASEVKLYEPDGADLIYLKNLTDGR
jgi:hypothetical protein